MSLDLSESHFFVFFFFLLSLLPAGLVGFVAKPDHSNASDKLVNVVTVKSTCNLVRSFKLAASEIAAGSTMAILTYPLFNAYGST